jgi:hypothetical protein
MREASLQMQLNNAAYSLPFRGGSIAKRLGWGLTNLAVLKKTPPASHPSMLGTLP